jgi:hypothetical protein
MQMRVAIRDWTHFKVLWCKDSELLGVGDLVAKIIAAMFATG